MLIRAYAFSKMRGAAPMKVGLKTARLSTIRSIRPSTAGGEADLQRQDQQDLPEHVREGQPEELEVVLVEEGHRVDAGALVDERVVGEQHALGPAGRCPTCR
jgi:hypothetical protein